MGLVMEVMLGSPLAPAVTQSCGWMLPLSPAPLVGVWVPAPGAVMEVRGFPAATGAWIGFIVEEHPVRANGLCCA